MRIYKYLHSCIVVEDKKKKLLIDPGTFTFLEKKVLPEVFKNISAVLVTHAHADHIDADAVKIVLKNNPGAIIISNRGVGEFLKPAGIPVDVFEEGMREVDGFTVEAVHAKHESILTPIPANTAYRINGSLIHPGDSMDKSILAFKGTKVLALPVIAPWTKQLSVAEFALNMKTNIAIPIHDGFTKDFFQIRQNTIYKEHLAKFDIDYRPLGPGEFVEI